MTFKLNFAESGESFGVKASGGEKTFSADVGSTTILYNGQNGATFFPSVSADGVLSWTNDRGLDNPEPITIKGEKGKDGISGKDGYTPIKGKDYFDGTNGKDGADGYTPIKGTDYFTEADKAEMVNSVIAALPIYNGEVVEV